MDVQYDSTKIYSFANSLYKEASKIIRITIIKYAFWGLVIGLVIGFIIANKMAIRNDEVLISILATVSGILGGFLGKQAGESKAFSLKLEAQKMLVFAKIEENTKVNVKNS